MSDWSDEGEGEDDDDEEMPPLEYLDGRPLEDDENEGWGNQQ